MNWGKGIVISFILFAAFIGVLVAVCVREDVNLVSKNYYADELAYQQQIERINNTLQLQEKPDINVVNGVMEVKFNQFNAMEEGEIKLFRPSDVRLDKQFKLLPSDQKAQQFDVRALPAGMYRIKMLWSMNGKEYYIENVITL